MRIRALIVDDEPLARRRVLQFLANEPDVEVVGECADGMRAVQVVAELAPDLVFLDVQMPEVDGFDVLEAIQGDCAPGVIFATAYDEYALRAFDANAVDYLLKPYTEERFRAAVARARARLQRGEQADLARQMRGLLDSLRPERRYADRLVVRVGPRIVFVKVADLSWIGTEGNYVQLHAGGRTFLMRETLANLGERLPPAQFIRIHRSTIVNVERIREIHPLFKGTYHIRLEDGTELSSTATYRDRIHALLEGAA